MVEAKRVTVWPASVTAVVERYETPFKLLSKKAGPVSRALWWALKKLGVLEPYFETLRTWNYVPHDQSDLMEAVAKAYGERLDYVADGEAVFIMGGSTFAELSGAPAFQNMMAFDAGPFGRHDSYGGRRIFNIPIHVVPNMTGMALVPRVLIETK